MDLAGLLSHGSLGDCGYRVRERSLPASSCTVVMSPFILKGRRGYPISIPLRLPGETLAPIRWPGQQRRVHVVSLLEGAALVLGDPDCL
jgi:hypothetical protein